MISARDEDTVAIAEGDRLVERAVAGVDALQAEPALGGDAVIGPILVGMEQPVQIAAMTASASDLVTLGVLAGSGVVR